MIKGIDISEHNETIDFGKVKASGINFVIIRIGWIGNKNNHTLDKYFEENYSKAKLLKDLMNYAFAVFILKFFYYAPVSVIFHMLLIRACKLMSTPPVCNEKQIVRIGGRQNRVYRIQPHICNRPRWQPIICIRIVWAFYFQVFAQQRPTTHIAQPTRQRINHRRIRLQAHIITQPIQIYTGHDGHF